MKKTFFISILCLFAFAINAQKFVDLGLPSGTKWKDVNESNINRPRISLFFNNFEISDAVSRSGGNTPTREQWEELMNECEWIWVDTNGYGYKVVGPNGNHIILPAEGYSYIHGDVRYKGTFGCYWLGKDGAFKYIFFNAKEKRLCKDERNGGLSLRLVID
ncbi:MAG: hypothetical protein IKX51_07220 [Bacteroidales bacterium]|nr:hypothetical protein [Bacteroidales bacterium]